MEWRAACGNAMRRNEGGTRMGRPAPPPGKWGLLRLFSRACIPVHPIFVLLFSAARASYCANSSRVAYFGTCMCLSVARFTPGGRNLPREVHQISMLHMIIGHASNRNRVTASSEAQPARPGSLKRVSNGFLRARAIWDDLVDSRIFPIRGLAEAVDEEE